MTRHSIFAVLHHHGTSPGPRDLRLAGVDGITGRGHFTRTSLRRPGMLAPTAYPGGVA